MNRYELHVTLNSRATYHQVMSKGWVGSAKILDIKLDSGIRRKQLMLGFEVSGNSFIDCHSKMKDIVRKVSMDFKVDRVKIEAHPDNRSDAYSEPEPIYYEAHWKVRLDAPPMEGAMVSFNLHQEDIKYLTIRKEAKDCTLASFKASYEWKTGILKKYLVKNPHMEIALVDTNMGMDKGWSVAA